MRPRQRVELRNLRCVSYFHRQRRTRTGVEFTEYTYHLKTMDGRSVEYSGKYLGVEPGCYIDVRATVKSIRGPHCFMIERPTMLRPHIDQPALL